MNSFLFYGTFTNFEDENCIDLVAEKNQYFCQFMEFTLKHYKYNWFPPNKDKHMKTQARYDVGFFRIIVKYRRGYNDISKVSVIAAANND